MVKPDFKDRPTWPGPLLWARPPSYCACTVIPLGKHLGTAPAPGPSLCRHTGTLLFSGKVGKVVWDSYYLAEDGCRQALWLGAMYFYV